MDKMISTLKWEGRFIFMHLRWVFVGIIIAVIAAFLVAEVGVIVISNTEAAEIGIQAVPVISSLLLAAITVAGVYVSIIFPIGHIIYDVYVDSAALDRAVARPYWVILAVKLFYNIIVYFIGFSVITLATTSIQNLIIGVNYELEGIEEAFAAINYAGLLEVSIYMPILVLFGYLLFFKDKAKISLKLKVCSIAVFVIAIMLGLFQGLVAQIVHLDNIIRVILLAIMIPLCCWIYENKSEV